MKIFNADFEAIWPIGSCLIIAAENIEEATEIAKKTIVHTTEFNIEEIDISKSGVVIYMSGDY